MELIVCSPSDSIYCVNANGSRVPGWPVKVVDCGANITASPAVGDIDDDGHLEMVVQSSAGRVYGLNHDGTTMTGWPKWIYSNTATIAPSPALADLDEDGKLEIVLARARQEAATSCGTTERTIPAGRRRTRRRARPSRLPIVADIDGDGSLDIVLATEEGLLNAWKQSGESVAGFPIAGRGLRARHAGGARSRLQRRPRARRVMLGSQRLRVGSYRAWYYRGCTQWNGFHGNIYNSGWKEFIPATGVDRITCVWRLFEGRG